MKLNNQATFEREAFFGGLTDTLVWEPTGDFRKAKKLMKYIAQLANRNRAYRASDYVRKATKRFGYEVRVQDVKRLVTALGLVQVGRFIYGKV